MNDVFLFLVMFLPVLIVVIIMFWITTNNIRRFKKALISVSKRFGWEFRDETNFFHAVAAVFEKGISFSERIKRAYFVVSFGKKNSASIIKNFQFGNQKVKILVSSKVVKVKEMNSIVSFVNITKLPFKFFFQLTNRDVFHSVEKLIIRDIQFNDPVFDPKFLILSDCSDMLLKIIDQDLRDKLVKLHNNAVIRYMNHSLYYEEEGYFKDAEYLENVVNIMITLLQKLFLYNKIY